MNAIVINTLTGAVSEYDWVFPGLSETLAGDDDGLYTLGGDDDNGAQISARVTTGKFLLATLKTMMISAYFTVRAAAGSWAKLTVYAGDNQYDTPFEMREKGVSRAKAGRGIKENFLGFGFSNLDGCDFELDQFEVNAEQSKQRRV